MSAARPRSVALARVIRLVVSGGAVAAVVLALAAYAGGRAAIDVGFGVTLAALVVVGALTRRYGVALPGNGFSSYVLAVVLYALLARGWTFAVLVAPFAMALG